MNYKSYNDQLGQLGEVRKKKVPLNSMPACNNKQVDVLHQKMVPQLIPTTTNNRRLLETTYNHKQTDNNNKQKEAFNHHATPKSFSTLLISTSKIKDEYYKLQESFVFFLPKVIFPQLNRTPLPIKINPSRLAG